MNFSDANFCEWVRDNCDKNHDSVLSPSEIAAVESINVIGMNIENLKGIEYFTALKRLDCPSNKIKQLNLSKNTKLEYLNCSFNNGLSTLNVSKNTALQVFYCTRCSLTSLDVSKNTALNQLTCSENQLTSLNVSNHAALAELNCYINQLTSVDVSNCPSLTHLNCIGNRIGEAAMERLVAGLPTLASNGGFYAHAPNLSDEQNVLTEAQRVKAVAKKWSVYYYDGTDWNNGKYVAYEIDMSAFVLINDTKFPDANFRQWVNDNCDTNHDGVLTEAELSAVKEMNISGKGISNLGGIEYFTALQKLDCSNNQLTWFSMWKNPALRVLCCNDNKLTSIDVWQNPALSRLDCYNNKLSMLDVTNNPALSGLFCYGNSLNNLDVSNNPNLELLNCQNNYLSTLDVSNNTKLMHLNCNINGLTSLDVSKNTELTQLDCSRNRLTSLEVTNNLKLYYLGCFCNNLNQAAMDKLVASLPQASLFGMLYAHAPYVYDEHNVLTEAHKVKAVAKKWTVYYWSGTYWDNGEFVAYETSVPTSLPTLSSDAGSDSPFYSLDGLRISGQPTKKGIYVRDGKKVVVK